MVCAVRRERLRCDISRQNFRKSDGTEVDCQLTANLRKDEDGLMPGYQAIMSDITACEKMQEALRSAYDELELRVQERTGELRAVNPGSLRAIGGPKRA
jgi:hypothetical protein